MVLHILMFRLLPLLFVLFLSACGEKGSDGKFVNPLLPPEGFVADISQGKKLFEQNCSRCHGNGARGSHQGPPLVHETYKPSHHADISFYMAVKNGVQQHHWHFGSMPAIKGVEKEQVGHILAYVRSEQQRAGIR
jgi:mono/diheme cytochrome c family protein